MTTPVSFSIGLKPQVFWNFARSSPIFDMICASYFLNSALPRTFEKSMPRM